MSVTISPYEDAAAAAVAALWNEEFGSRYPLTPQLLAARTGPIGGTVLSGWVARKGGEPAGALLVRFPSLPWFPPGVGFVTLLVVARAARQQGIGRALLDRAVQEARRLGYRTLVFGGGPGHLVPGIPAEAPLATWRFLRRAGAVPREIFHDLLVDLTTPLPPAELPADVVLEPAPREPMLTFLAAEFPGEWEVDIASAYDAGATVYGLWQHGQLIGFAATHQPGEWPPAPSLFWNAALDGPVAGLGPLGIAAAARGRGLGLAMVCGALQELRRTQARYVVIDWTTLASFYGRAGAHVWRTYQMAALPLDEA